MNIEINPKLVSEFTALATGQGMTPEAYAAHVIEKYVIAQVRSQTASFLTALSTDEIKEAKTQIVAIIEARPKESSETSGIITK